jgi:phosphatidate cytidylyltransferase
MGSDLYARVLAAVPAIAFAIFIVAEGGWIFAIGVAALGVIMLHELFRMYAHVAPVRLAGFAAAVALAWAAEAAGTRQVLLALVAFVPLMFLVTLVMPRSSVAGIAITTLGVVWIGMALAHAVLLRKLQHGDGIVVDVLVGTFVGDTAAYAGGRLFGRRQLAPAISPSKTIEGLVCGMLGAILAVFIAGLYQTWLTQGDALLLGVAVALLAPLGDLFESLVKRDAGVKDAGTLFGAHGGALDRLDAALFTVVVGYYVWQAVVH